MHNEFSQGVVSRSSLVIYVSTQLPKEAQNVGRTATASKPRFTLREVGIAGCQLIHIGEFLAIM
jgi:hypothetical protein